MQMYSSAAHYSDRVWCPPLTPRGHLSLGLLPSQSQRFQRFGHWEGHAPLPCSFLLGSHHFSPPHGSSMRLVFKGFSISPVSDHFPEAPSTIQILPVSRHLWPPTQVLNKLTREDIYRLFIQVTCTSPSTSLGSKMSYLEHFLEFQDGIIVCPPCTHKHWMHSLKIPLGQLKVGSHRLWVETDHHIPRSERIFQVCHLQEPEIEVHLIFRCPLYQRSEDITTASIETQGFPSLLSLDIRTRDAQPSSLERFSATDISSYTPCLALG